MIAFVDVRHPGSYCLRWEAFLCLCEQVTAVCEMWLCLGAASSWLLVRTILDQSMHETGCAGNFLGISLSPSPPPPAPRRLQSPLKMCGYGDSPPTCYK